MKTKRQTIWLVSMLSLMVVLSAYYLFTEDSGPAATSTNEGQQVTATDTQGGKGASAASDGTIVSEVTDESAAQDGTAAAGDDQTSASANQSSEDAAQADESGTAAADQTQTDKAANDTAGKTDNSTAAADSGKQTAKTDEEVLETAEAQGTAGSDIVSQYQFDRVEANGKKADELYQVMNDLTKTPEENAEAANELNALQDKESKINDIEEQVSQKYGTAVVKEEDNSYMVVVMNDKLQAKDAASIVDLVISELGVSQDQVKVQYVSTAK
ncbi:SpoIIIAH-like family protein [Paenibacillus pinistramenti]|uniref:SpoIIIAH-like family protein n=1 Tax=Paenibacillus pinistramenti TaxID=1768003 RepID=UPI0011089A28|nr:SpoIIIAH-like family protein [Paenibacillus pinistramenti]